MKFIWFPLFFTFFLIELFFNSNITCGSTLLTGNMWFMWLMMSLSTINCYIIKIKALKWQ